MSNDGITVSYSSNRKEVARFYWRSWKRRLWRVHLLTILVVIVLGFALRLPTVVVIGICATVVALFIVYPQLAFKPQTRILTIDASGIETKIGKMSGIRKWSEIESIEEDTNAIVMTVRATGNAFIVPRRAFQSDGERQSFLAAARTWAAAATA